MNFTQARQYILNRIRLEFADNLYYHSLSHVLDVEQAAIRLCQLEGVNDYDKMLVLTAVAFHDAGFIYQTKDHEDKGCEIVRDCLPEFGYNNKEIDSICGMIMATKIPQSPSNLFEQIICDADLDYLGRNDFWEIGDKLFEELKSLGVLSNKKEWNLLQIKFLKNHQYFTPSAIKLRKKIKEEHLNSLIKKVED
jgi:uncharacterized protein